MNKNLGFLLCFAFVGLFIAQAEPAVPKKSVHNLIIFGQIMHHESYYLDQAKTNASLGYEENILFQISDPFIFMTHVGAGYSYMYPVYDNFMLGGDVGFGLNVIKTVVGEPALIFPLNLKVFVGTDRFGVQFNGGVSAYLEDDLLIPYDSDLFNEEQVGWNVALFGQVGGAIKLTNLGLGLEYHFAFDDAMSVHGETDFLVFKCVLLIQR